MMGANLPDQVQLHLSRSSRTSMLKFCRVFPEVNAIKKSMLILIERQNQIALLLFSGN